MKITQEEPGRMVLKDYNISQFIGGFVFAAIGIGLILFFGSPTKIETYLFGAIFALTGIYMVLTTKIINISLEKIGKCRFSIWKLIGGESTECSANEIKELRLEKMYNISSHGKVTYVYTLNFVLENGRELRFEFGTVSPSIMDVLNSPHAKIRAEAKQIADFLGASFTEVSQPSAAGITQEIIHEQMKRIQEQLERAKKT